MKLASFSNKGVSSWGIVEDGYILDVGAKLRGRFSTLREAIAADALALAAGAAKDAERLKLESVKLLPVITDSAKVLCVGLNYETHRRETGRPVSEYPTIFTRYPDSLIGHGENIILPHVSTMLDYEGELAIIIGKGGRYIRRENALQHVAGYACHNDATIRDWQRHTSQFTPGKTFPGTGPLGPYLVTPDEIADLDAMTLETRLNGAVVQSATIGQMIFPVAHLIEYISSFTPLSPGDVIASGTPGGVGVKREPPLFMKPGDRVEVEISGVGLLVNGIANEG
ncbi:MAG: fumarylacetoacetate hydrolase family protein [Pseudomonadota bacterium]|nr:fumarylacetoacetate hydrolase family protein [Pseudomonadota bacterium]